MLFRSRQTPDFSKIPLGMMDSFGSDARGEIFFASSAGNSTLPIPYSLAKVNSLNFSYIFQPSNWPMDTFSSSSVSGFYSGGLIDISGRMMTLDNPSFISSSYSGVGFPAHLPPSGAFVPLLNFGRNHNTNRPKNVVFEQA